MFGKFGWSVTNGYRVGNEEVLKRAETERELASKADQGILR